MIETGDGDAADDAGDGIGAETVAADEAHVDADDVSDGDADDADADDENPGAEGDHDAEDKDEDGDAAEDDAAESAGALDRLFGNRALVLGCAVVAVVIAAILGYVVGAGLLGSHGTASATLTEDQLDSTTVASYTYGGATHEVTAREALESAYILSQIENEDGTYPAPSGEVTLACVRRDILVAEARARGIEATEDEVAAYAQEVLGTDDFASIAESYETTEDGVRQIAEESLLTQKLYEQIVPEVANLTVPTMPTAPEDGAEDTPTADYASYLIGLLGDEWDSETGTWARTDGPFYQALSGEEFSGDAATYGQAVTAYYVAYQRYSDAATAAQATWTEYANGIYGDVEITLNGIYQ